jgi:hypothetical protein
MKRALFVAGLALLAVPAFADTSADQSKVEVAPKAQGYTLWKSIVLDKGTWEVDDRGSGSISESTLRL